MRFLQDSVCWFSLGILLKGVQAQEFPADRVTRPMEVLTLVHVGDYMTETVLYPYIDAVRQSLMHQPLANPPASIANIPKVTWTYSTGQICDPTFTPGEGRCYRRQPDRWFAGTNPIPWMSFVEQLHQNSSCAAQTRDPFPVLNMLAHAATSSSFSAPSREVNRVIILITQSSPDTSNAVSGVYNPNNFRCDYKPSISIQQFAEIFATQKIYLYVIAPPRAAFDWFHLAYSAGFGGQHRLGTFEAVQYTAATQQRLQTSLYFGIAHWNAIQWPHPLPTTTTTTTTTRRTSTTPRRPRTTSTTTVRVN